MSRAIGFHDFPQGWEGPKVMMFTYLSEHTTSVRYRARLSKRMFDLYLPSLMLPANAPPPSEILVAVGRSLKCMQTIGFNNETVPLEANPQVCEFEFEEKMANSIKYRLRVSGQSYALYAPKEIFGNEQAPGRVFLQVAIPTSEVAPTIEQRIASVEDRLAALERLTSRTD